MLQQNWALIESNENEYIIYFIGDTSGVFDQMAFVNSEEAERQLRKNGFSRYAEDTKAQEFIIPPSPPFYESTHPNGPIYSSGRFWTR